MRIYENNKSSTTKKTDQKQLICSKCAYERKPSDSAPLWQCPCCEAAYAKVSQDYIKSFNKKSRAEYAQQEKDKSNSKKKTDTAAIGISTFSLGATIMNGATKGCVCIGGILATPVVAKLIGASLIFGSIIYLATKFSS